jgi:hypothetical protein
MTSVRDRNGGVCNQAVATRKEGVTNPAQGLGAFLQNHCAEH